MSNLVLQIGRRLRRAFALPDDRLDGERRRLDVRHTDILARPEEKSADLKSRVAREQFGMIDKPRADCRIELPDRHGFRRRQRRYSRLRRNFQRNLRFLDLHERIFDQALRIALEIRPEIARDAHRQFVRIGRHKTGASNDRMTADRIQRCCRPASCATFPR